MVRLASCSAIFDAFDEAHGSQANRVQQASGALVVGVAVIVSL